jgi:hypothetical protein
MDAKTRRDLLDEHIPYRMRHVDALRWACEILQAGRPDALELWVDGRPRHTSIRFLTNPLVEAGAIAGRVLLGFLGIGLRLDKKAATLRVCHSRRGDVTLKNFDLDLLPPTDIERRGIEAREACIRLLWIANQGIAHLTFKDTELDDVPKLHRAACLIPTLVCEALYDRLSHSRPKGSKVEFLA